MEDLSEEGTLCLLERLTRDDLIFALAPGDSVEYEDFFDRVASCVPGLSGAGSAGSRN